MPDIGKWSVSGTGDGTEHVCQVVFYEDGDYTFTVEFVDLAGNRADYSRVDEFTIDRTTPVLTVEWDHHEREHEIYYAKSRLATVDILERNFSENLIHVEVTRDGETFSPEGAWSRQGDHHQMEVGFSEDGEYTIRISGEDEAGHSLEGYGPERFVIDRTPPRLDIFGVSDSSANKGAVMPGIRCYDGNPDWKSMDYVLSGSAYGPVEPDEERETVEGGMEILWKDFPHVPESDDLYRMEAVVRDLAGNKSEASVLFSVNRFGSVYGFDEATEKLVGTKGSYYTDRGQDIVVTETNVDTLQYQEITCNLNGKLRILKEGEDFAVTVGGMNTGWRQYTYTISRGNFTEEGIYILSIYSEDKAENVSDNGTKGKRIEFAVDRTAPDIRISGVEDGGQYRRNRGEVTLDVQDNLRMDSVELLVDGIGRVYGAEELETSKGRITVPVDGADHWQDMRVTARDAAGNESVVKLRFLVTPNIFVQLFWNRALPGVLVGIGFLVLLAIAGIRLRFSGGNQF